MITITDNNSTITIDELTAEEKKTAGNVSCDVSIIEKYDDTFIDFLYKWLSPLLPDTWQSYTDKIYGQYKLSLTLGDDGLYKLYCYDKTTNQALDALMILPKKLCGPFSTLAEYAQTIVEIKSSQEYKETLIKEEYLDKYGEKWSASNVVINIDSTNDANDIKKYLSYSGILGQRINHLYVNNSSGQYEIVSVKEIYAELVERGFYTNADVSVVNQWEFVMGALEGSNPSFDFSSSSDRYLDNTYGKILETVENIYFLLKDGEEILFPTEYDGSYSVKLYARDSVGTTLSSGSGNDTLYGGAKNDSILGNAGNDIVYGGNGSDTVRGGDGADIIYGASNDGTAETLVGTKGNYLYGDAGDDIIWAGGVGKDYLDGGAGADKIKDFNVIELLLKEVV